MMRAVAILLALLACPGPAGAQTREMPEIPEIIVEITPAAALDTATYVQAQLRMTVQIAGRYPYEALKVTLPEVENAEVAQIMRPRTRFIRTYAGAGYVYEAAYAIFPQRSGTLALGPLRATGLVGKSANEDLAFDIASRPFTIQVEPATDGIRAQYWFPADEVSIEQTWSIPLDQIRDGEVVRREVHVKAWGTTADRLPPLAMPRTIGATSVDAGRATDTEITRHGMIGHLWQSWDIRIDRQNFAEIAPVRLDYWNTTEHSEAIVSLPVVRIEPLPADSDAIAERLMAEEQALHRRDNWIWILLLIAMSVPAGAMGLRLALAAMPSSADLALWRGRKDRGPALFYAALTEWAQTTAPGSSADPVGTLHERATPEFSDGLRGLERAIFATASTEPDQARLVALALRHGRRERVARLTRGLARFWRAIVGERRDLQMPDRARQQERDTQSLL